MGINTMGIGDRILHIARIRGISQTKLAQELGISQATISAWGKQGKNPSSARISDVARVLGVSVDYLLTGEGEPLIYSCHTEITETQSDTCAKNDPIGIIKTQSETIKVQSETIKSQQVMIVNLQQKIDRLTDGD
jgi:transcriptional regulator with XRE-family HTH domain